MKDDRTFYQNLNSIDDILEVTNPAHYRDIPSDWHIAITDVRGSTVAIKNGRYKDVNGIAAASITALLNAVPNIELPFVFGGDGATILVPPSAVEATASALRATQTMAQEQFNLQLRVGIVPVADVLADGYAVKVTKLKMSDDFQQAIFTGGGLAHADRLIKAPEHSAKYLIADDGEAEADYTGFECRWNAIPGKNDEVLSLIIMATGDSDAQNNDIYRQILETIHELYGDSHARHPITLHHLNLALHPRAFTTEARIRHRNIGMKTLLKLAVKSFIGALFIRFNYQNWGRYPHHVMGSVDNEKFDDTLRMIISGDAQQRAELRDFLENLHQQGLLVYGIHQSTHTLMTCIVFDRFGRQTHFVDGSDGGYALAAQDMKKQLARDKQQSLQETPVS